MSGSGPTGSWQERSCYEDVSERKEGMTETGIAARLARSRHRASMAGWLTSGTEGVRWRLDVEAGRFLFDDGRPLPRRPTPAISQGHNRVLGSTASGQDAGSRMRKGDRAKGSSWWRTQAYAGGRGSRDRTNATKRRVNEVSPTDKTSITVWRAIMCLEPIGSLIATILGPPSATTMS